ncbi:family 78 glycoside hydrolase catalytic domain [Saccharopolyspora sp. NPDC002578]
MIATGAPRWEKEGDMDRPGPTRRTVLKATAGTAAFVAMSPGGTAAAGPGIRVTGTGVEHAAEPLGLDVPRPRLSWHLGSDARDQVQSAYRLLVATSADLLREGSADVWDSGEVPAGDSLLVEYGGPPLRPRTRYWWSVRVWDAQGTASPYGEPAWWETGLQDAANWTARWIRPPDGGTAQLRKDFHVAAPVVRARLYATALGVYEPELNGHRVGDHRLAPGWTDYRVRVQYQTYDVTELVRDGDNVLGAHLGPGWYAGHVGMFGPGQYGDRPLLRAQLELDHADGSRSTVGTDDGWRTATGAIRSSDLLMGEEQDARAATPGWSSPGYDASSWTAVEVDDGIAVAPVAQADPPVRATEQLPAVNRTEPAPGTFVYDLGQNIVGVVRLHVDAAAGTEVRVRHAEVLNPDGTAYTDNLREATATDTYVLAGGAAVLEPKFTFHGFRYVEVTGAAPEPADVVGLVLHSDLPQTMSLSTDQPMLDRLQRNITWGQRGNFLSIPTDTPARDERLGWTGDINVFCGTAAYVAGSAGFLAKWTTDLRDAQSADGAFPDVAPAVGDLGAGTAGWGDAGVTVPWLLYERFGDRRALAENYPAMLRWLDHLTATSDGDLRPADGARYGDWLNVDEETRRDLIATAWVGYAARAAAQAADALGETADAQRHRDHHGRVREAFQRAYLDETGRLRDDAAAGRGDTQTGYVLALSFDLVPAELRAAGADRLVSLIEQRGGHLATGFLGTPYLLPVLTDTGHLDTAYRLLEQREFPSWGYQIDRGATTMWERWDSIRPDGEFNDPSMNSFNHYAYGSVGEWMYRTIAGIEPLDPGFRRVLVRPRPGGGVRRAAARFSGPYGEIATRWSRVDGGYRLEAEVPVNTTAEVHVPIAVRADPNASFIRRDAEYDVYEIGSGKWEFTS